MTTMNAKMIIKIPLLPKNVLLKKKNVFHKSIKQIPNQTDDTHTFYLRKWNQSLETVIIPARTHYRNSRKAQI